MIEITEIEWADVVVGGKDALSFAQGQFSQEISSESRRTLLLSPDGHVVAGGSIVANDGEIRFTVPKDCAEMAMQRLRRFVLRVDVSLDVDDDVEGPCASAVDLLRGSWPYSPEWKLQLPPHSYGQWVVDSCVSFSKGCFTGQELVGRADARGATMPWRFVGGCTDDVEPVHRMLQETGPDGPKGVTSWCRDESNFLWRGVAHRSWNGAATGHIINFMA